MSGDPVEPEVPVELDSSGLSTGVEREDPDDRIDEPFDPEKIDVLTRTPTVDLLLSRLRRGVLDLEPDFQRRAGIWTEQNQSRLIESMLLRIPLPTLYAAERGDEEWVIVDGIQRLTTIARFVDPASVGAEPLVLQELEYLRPYEGKGYSDLPGRLQTRLAETELVVHLIRRGTPEQVMFNIFARINTGGRPLSRQELRHALIPGPARGLLKRLAESKAYLDATQGSVSPERMDDREMVLRFFAFRITDPTAYVRKDFDGFLREAMHALNGLGSKRIAELEDEFVQAIFFAMILFGAHAFRKRLPGQERRFPINKALFEAISVNLAKRSDAQLGELIARRRDVERRLADLFDDVAFERAVSVGTGEVAKVQKRFGDIDDMLNEVLND